MPSTPFAIALLAASTFAAFAAMPCRAADLSIGPKAGKQADARGARKGPAGKARRNDKDAPRKIVTYKLFQDPVFKLNGTLADKRQLDVPPVFERLGQGHPVLKAPANAASQAGALKLQEPESTGIDFGCGDKPFRSGARTRELTACYKHNVDKSWKTQTYLSREYTEGSQKWGGGLAVRYAY